MRSFRTIPAKKVSTLGDLDINEAVQLLAHIIDPEAFQDNPAALSKMSADERIKIGDQRAEALLKAKKCVLMYEQLKKRTPKPLKTVVVMAAGKRVFRRVRA